MRLTVHISSGHDLAALRAAIRSCQEVADEIEVVELGVVDPAQVEAAESMEDLRAGPSPEAENDAEAARRWHLRLQPHERLSPQLREALRDLASREPSATSYRVRRRTFVLGREMTTMGLGSEAPIRLDMGPFAMRVKGQGLPTIQAPIDCHPVPSIDAFLRDTDAGTDQDRAPVAWSARRLVLGLPTRFLRLYIVGSGWRDGFPGYLWASLQAITVFLQEMRRWVEGRDSSV